MNEHLLKLIQKYKSKGVLTDTNILVLYIIGSFDRSLIRKLKVTSQFSEDDFLRVARFIDYFNVKVTTPHVLTETSNLLKDRKDLHNVLKYYIENSEEENLDSKQLSQTGMFLGFGLADTAISETAKDSYLIVTNENNLFGYLQNQGFDVVNLEQIRSI